MKRRPVIRRVDANQRSVVQALRRCGCRVLVTSSLGGGAGDLLVLRPGHGLRILEVKDGAKSPSRRALTTKEAEFHRLWAEAVSVVTGPREALAAMGLGLRPIEESAP